MSNGGYNQTLVIDYCWNRKTETLHMTYHSTAALMRMKLVLTEKYQRRGFTLIELLVVIAIIGILAAVGVVAYNGYTASAKENVCKDNHNKIKKIIVEKKTLCELDNTITLRTWYSSHKQGAEYSFNCSNNFESLSQNVGIHMTNYLKNPYSPNDHWGYSWIGNSGTPTQDGRTYYYTNNNTIRLRTLCNGKLIEDTLSGN